MALGLIVKTGRILTAKLLLGQAVDGITHCAIGDGDASFADPQNPPAPDIGQTGLRNERARKRYYKRTFLKEDAEAALLVNGVRYLETGEETNTIGIFFRFDEAEANGITIREYGFFGGDVQYVESVTGDLAMGGVFHQASTATAATATARSASRWRWPPTRWRCTTRTTRRRSTRCASSRRRPKRPATAAAACGSWPASPPPWTTGTSKASTGCGCGSCGAAERPAPPSTPAPA